MKNKKKAFSVIEIVLVLGVIGILSSFIAPKVRDYLAMAKDSKAINTLQNLRMASETYYLENGNYPWGIDDKIEDELLIKLEKYTGKKIGISESEPFLEIGGSKKAEKDSDVIYGGKIEVIIDSNRGFILNPIESTLKFNIRGEEWSSI